MRNVSAFVASASVVAAILASSTPARADLVNPTGPLTRECKLTQQRPYPVVLVHGQAGFVAGMQGVTDRLAAEGYCVYGIDYGAVPGGANGQDHLWNSAGQIASFVDQVLGQTGAKMVEMVGHSAGTGVIDNFIMQKGGASKVHSFVSFGGLHHPYWHLGLATFADIDIHLPNLIAFGRMFFPFITIDMITDIIAGMVGDPGLKATINSPFVEDLFDGAYWNALHGGSSEPPGVFVKILTQGRTLPTRDSIQGICNTNIIGLGDMLVGVSTGYQDINANIDNFITTSVVTANTHNDMLGNPDALDKMIAGLQRTCGASPGLTPQSISPLDNAPVANESAEELEARRKKRQNDFARVFLQAVQEKYGDVLGPSKKPFPGSDGSSDSEDGDDSSSSSASSCSVSAKSGAKDGWMVAALGAVAAVFGIRARRKKTTA